ncbi:hypothetical protein FACS1894188_10250 [Clostridia bacterium]|nr:hypothetical protein FACS1894188_10250 [Clostridia bacterium]
MVEVFDYSDLTAKIGEVDVVSGTESLIVNEPYRLTAVTTPKLLKVRGVSLTPKTVYKYNGVFYRQLEFDTSDEEVGSIDIDACDLLHADLIDSFVSEFKHTATLRTMMNALLAGTIFTLGECEASEVKTIDLKNVNKQTVLSSIMDLFQVEIEKELLIVNMKNKFEYLINNAPYLLKKGINLVNLKGKVDTSKVITRLFYRDSNIADDSLHSLDGAYIGIYPAPKTAYKEFKGNAAQKAAEYLLINQDPLSSYTVQMPFNFDLSRDFKLGTLTQLLCEQLGINLNLRVVSIEQDITWQTGDTYVLGKKAKTFNEIIAESLIETTRLNGALNIPELVQEVYNQVDSNVTNIIEQSVVNNIETIIRTDVISADTATFLACWSRDVVVDYLETNFEALLLSNPSPTLGLRELIRIHGANQEYIIQELSNEPTPYFTPSGRPVYWTSIEGDEINVTVPDDTEQPWLQAITRFSQSTARQLRT